MTDDAAAIARLEAATPPAEPTFAETTHATRAGKVDLGSGKAQHVDLFRKLKLRRELLAKIGPGAAFVPFLGEADIALELYQDRALVGVELDPGVAQRASDRLFAQRPDGPRIQVITGDAEVWHEIDRQTYAVLDVDAFSNPYRTIELAWKALLERDVLDTPGLADRVAIFGTDGMRLAIRQSKSRYYPSPTSRKLASGTISDKRRQWNAWWTGFIRPWLEQLVAPATIVVETKYLREHMLYFGIVVDRSARNDATIEPQDPEAGAPVTAADDPAGGPTPPAPEVATPRDPSAPASAGDIADVEAALLEAARSGNVPAAIFWLEHKGGPTWTKTSPAEAMLERLTSGPRSRR